MQQVYIGPSHSMSWHGFDNEKTSESIFEGKSPLSGILNVIEEAQKNNSPLPITKIVDTYYEDVQKMSGNRWDTSSLIKRLRKK